VRAEQLLERALVAVTNASNDVLWRHRYLFAPPNSHVIPNVGSRGIQS